MRVKRSSPNLVTTGMDEAIPYLTSNFFSYKFKGNKGKVIEVSDKFIVYEDTETKERGFVDISEKTMKNSDGGFYVTLRLKPNVKKGQILKNNDILAYDPTSYSKQIGSQKDDNGISYNVGTMSKIAIMTTDEAFNDSTVITESLSDSMSSDYCIEKARYLPKDTNLYHIVQKGMPIQEGEPLLILQNAFEEKDANILLKAITDDDVEAVSDLGRIHVRSKLTGVVQDIKIFRTCELDELSPSLKKLVTSYENRIKKEKAELKKTGVQNVDGLLDPDYKLEAQGKLKDCLDGVKIFIYIKCHDNMGVGDKLVFSTALKGVIKTVIPKGEEPYTDFRPDEKVEALLTTAGVNARMVGSIILNGLINKVLIETDRKCKDLLGIKWKNLYDIDANE
jgi:DNA-directed RNA polymerase beta subunit